MLPESTSSSNSMSYMQDSKIDDVKNIGRSNLPSPDTIST